VGVVVEKFGVLTERNREVKKITGTARSTKGSINTIVKQRIDEHKKRGEEMRLDAPPGRW
jgi:hypothetical protein